jgi:validoxylamine A glucosyltransferase
MPQTPAVSVVIPTYNRAEMLGHTLRSLAGQAGDRDAFEVVVADDGSSDDTADVVAGYRGSLRVRHVYRPRDEEEIARMGGYCVSRIRNFGARHAAAPLILFLDSGVVAGPGLVDAHRAAHAGGGARIAVLGYTFGTNKVRPFRPLEEMLRTHPPEEIVAAIGDGPRGLDLRHADLIRMEFDMGRMAAPWIFFWTLNLSLRAADFWSAGGFDERFRGWGYEDVELGYRLVRDGTALTASRAAWAIEWPNWPDFSSTHDTSERNRFYFRGKFQDPDLELYFNIYTRRFLPAYEEAHAELRAWCDEVRGRDVHDELAAIAPPEPGELLVLGCGDRVPAGWPAVTLADFDADALGRATATGGHTGVHCIGCDTGLPDGAVRRVVVTSRLRGLWPRWEAVIREEAARLGGEVVLTFETVRTGSAGA